MPLARGKLVSSTEPGVYHVMARCVRHSYLCGFDEARQLDCEHRRGWFQERLGWLLGSFNLEVLSYAVMSNHVHLVVRTDPQGVGEFSDLEVLRRWHRLFSQSQVGGVLTHEEVVKLLDEKEKLSQWRTRLGNLSWFMRCLCEWIARRANREDEVTGRFWEGRFKSQCLKSERAVLACMVYVDLNPVRAGLAETPEVSEFTGVYDRICARRERALGKAGLEGGTASGVKAEAVASPAELAAREAEDARVQAELEARFGRDGGVVGRRGRVGLSEFLCGLDDSETRPLMPKISEEAYLKLVDWTSRKIVEGKGFVSAEQPPILERLAFAERKWVREVRHFGSLYYHVVGTVEELSEQARAMGQKWLCRRRLGAQGYHEEEAEGPPGAVQRAPA